MKRGSGINGAEELSKAQKKSLWWRGLKEIMWI